jgi:hypothetical protein
VALALAKESRTQTTTTLGIEGTRFTLNGRPTFLLGASYYAGLGASDVALRRDLDDLTRLGFNWVRVWATWDSFGHDVSAVDARGEPREPYLGRLKALVAECDRRGVVVDVTLTRGTGAGRVADLAAHRRAVEVIIPALKAHRNWYLDLANECDVRDARFVAVDDLKELREDVRRLDTARIVTASFGGHDLDKDDLRHALVTAGLDFLAPHRPRTAESPGHTAEETRKTLDLMKRLGRSAPVHYQEPLRRGYETWNPTSEDFLTDLRGALKSGAAGWCFHNGSERNAKDGRPRRSFDLSDRRLFDQLDEEERKVVGRAQEALTSPPR